jgi:hypothetical protein
MNYKRNKREKPIGMIIACSFLGAAFLALTGCATVATVKTDEEQVAERAQEWLDAVRQMDFGKAVTYTTPAFRQTPAAAAYSGRYAGANTWTAGEVGKIECQQVDRCDVQIMVTYQLGRPRIENSRPLDKVWIKVENQWYIYES